MSSRGETLAVMKLNLKTIFMLIILHTVNSYDSCPEGQVDRSKEGTKICCHPIKCKPGQQFLLCQKDNGYDTCQNCPDGYGHKDIINTLQWKYFVDLCIELEDCSVNADQRLENDECVCDRTKGYFGLDRNKCSVDENDRCRKAGYQLTQTGECEICGDSYFKSKDDYSLCMKKTRCESDQEISDTGSHLKDRTCRKKIRRNIPVSIIRNVSNEIKVEGSKTNVIGNGIKNTPEGHNSSIGIKDENNGVEKGEESEMVNLTTLIVVIVIAVALAILLGIVAAWMIYGICTNRGSENNNGQDKGRNSIVNIISCCARQVDKSISSTNNTQDKSCTYNIGDISTASFGGNVDGKQEFAEETSPMVAAV